MMNLANSGPEPAAPKAVAAIQPPGGWRGLGFRGLGLKVEG